MKHNRRRLLAVLLLLALLPGTLNVRAAETAPTISPTEPAEAVPVGTTEPETTEPSTEATEPETTEPSTEATEPETTEPSTEATEPETTEPSTETTEPETTEPSTETTEPETTEPSTEATEPETTEPSTEATEPETTEPSTEVTEPETTEPSTEATEPETTEPSEEETQPATEETLPVEMPVLLTLTQSEPVEITLFPGEEYDLSELGTVTEFEVQNSDGESLTDSGLTVNEDGILSVSEDTVVGVYMLLITHTDSEGSSTVAWYQITVELIRYHVHIPAQITVGEKYRLRLETLTAPSDRYVRVTADEIGTLTGENQELSFANRLSGSVLAEEDDCLTGLVTVTDTPTASGTYTGQLNFQLRLLQGEYDPDERADELPEAPAPEESQPEETPDADEDKPEQETQAPTGGEGDTPILFSYCVDIPQNITVGEPYTIRLEEFTAPEGSYLTVTADTEGTLTGNGRTVPFVNGLDETVLNTEGDTLTGLVTVTKVTAISGTYTGQLNFQISYVPAA